jgi:hypothetical protein
LRLQSLPRCRAAPGASARAAAVLGWCSPQSSVPRQTVGHHARAATYEMGLKQRPAKAAAERCLGEPRQPPRRSFLFLLSHIPTGQGAVGRTARRALGWISQSRKTRFVCVLQKMGSRARARQRGRSRTRRRHRTDRASADRLARLPSLLCLPACSLLVYPPARAQWRARPGGLWGGLPDPAKLDSYAFCKKGARELARPRGSREGPRAQGRPPPPPPEAPCPPRGLP